MKVVGVILLIFMLCIILISIAVIGVWYGVKSGEKEAGSRRVKKRLEARDKHYIRTEFSELVDEFDDEELDKKRLTLCAQLMKLHDAAKNDRDANWSLTRVEELYGNTLHDSLAACRLVMRDGSSEQREQAVSDAGRMLDSITELIGGAINASIENKLDDIAASAMASTAVDKL